MRTSVDIAEYFHQKACGARVPFSVHIDLTYRCHQRCLHCYLPESWRQGEGPGPEMTTAQIIGLIDQLAELGTLFLIFSGGEIFLRPDLMVLVEYARKLNFSLSLFTSGTFGLERDQLIALSDIGIEGLYVSYYSLNAETHDMITGAPGSHKQLSHLMGQCQALGINVVLDCMIFDLNYLEIPDIKNFAAREGIPLRVDPDLVARWDKKPHLPGLVLSEEGREYLRDILAEDEKGPLTPSQDLKDWACGAGFSLCSIRPTGEVWPCLEVQLDCGSLLKEPFGHIWQGSGMFSKVREFHKHLAKSDERLCAFCRENSDFRKIITKRGGV